MTDLAAIKAGIDCRRLFAAEFPNHYRQHGNSLCPWHDDRDPSLQVETDHVYCHGEGKLFSCFDIVMLSRGVSFPQAKQVLNDAGFHTACRGGNATNTKKRIPYPTREAAKKTAESIKRAAIVAQHDYVYEDGSLAYLIFKHRNKTFTPIHQEGDKWFLDMGNLPRILYRLPELRAADPNAPVILCEGEKDADTARDELGLVATAIPFGAKSIKRSHRDHAFEPFRDRLVIVCGDCDPDGEAFNIDAAKILTQGIARDVRILRLPNPREVKGYDLTNLTEDLGSDKALKTILELIDAAPIYKPEKETQAVSPVETATVAENCTDMGNTRRLAAHFGDRIRFCKALGWMVFDGRRWVPDDCAQIQGFAKETVRRIYGEAERAVDEDARKRLARWAMSCETAHKVGAMVQLLPSEPGISASQEEFDRDKMVLNLENGTLDLNSGMLRDHNKDDLLTRLAPVTFDPQATCPRWERFILEIMDGATDLAEFLKRLLGYGICGDTKEQVWCFFWGKGANGKSTLLETLSHVIGDYSMNAGSETFIETARGSIRSDLARLKGARLVTSSEPKIGKFDAEVLKAFTGEEMLTARFLYQKEFDYHPEALLCFASNHRPAVRDTSHAFWRRLLLIPFVRQFSDEERDPKLRETLRSEASGILNWLIEGCLEWQSRGLNPPASVIEAVKDYRLDTDILGDFIEITCTLNPAAQIPRQALYATYQGFCEDHGIRRPMSQRSFNENLLSREGITYARVGTAKVHVWKGIGLRAPEAAEPPHCGIRKSRTCRECDFEQCCPTESQRRDPNRCKNYKPCG